MPGRRREPAEGDGCPGGVRGGGSRYRDQFLSPHARRVPAQPLPCSALHRLPVAQPRGSPSPPSSPGREPLLAPTGGGEASTATPPALSRASAPAGAKLPALSAGRNARGSSALSRAARSVPQNALEATRVPAGQRVEPAFGFLGGGPSAAAPQLWPALALPGNCRHSSQVTAYQSPKAPGENPGSAVKHGLGCEALGEATAKVRWQATRDCGPRMGVLATTAEETTTQVRNCGKGGT